MDKINLQAKTSAEKGTIELYWFENEHIGLKRTLFHTLHIPLKSFDSGLEYETQPVETEIVMDWLKLQLENPINLDGLTLSSTPEDDTEVSIYLGSAHNPCDIQNMSLKKIGDQLYEINCTLLVDFEYERVAPNEVFSFSTQVTLDEKIKER